MYEDTKLIYERSINMKKLISLVLVIFMTAIIPLSAVAEVEANSFDVNGDGKVNMFDYIFIKGIYFGSIDTVPEFDGADVNGDGTVNIFDCVLVKQAYLSSDDQVTPDEKDIPYTAHGLSGSLEEYDSQGIRPEYGMELDSFLVTDFDQLNALLDTYLNYGNSVNDEPFIDFAEALPENYFESKALVVTPVFASSGGDLIEIEGVKVYGSEILTEISVDCRGLTEDCQNRLMTAEVNKSDISGCTSARAEIIKVVNYYGEEKYISYVGHSLSGYLESCSQILGDDYGDKIDAILVTDFDQLNALLEDFVDYDGPISHKPFNEFAEELSENYFDTKALVIAPAATGAGSTKYTVEGVKTDENGILMEISAVLYGESYSAPQAYLMTAEVDKSDIIGCTSASGEIVESNIYGIDHYFTADSYIVTEEILPHRLITNFEQLEELCDGNPELAEYAESLPEGFFDTKVLTLTQIELADGSYVAYTAAVTYGKQGLTVYIEKYSLPGIYPDLFTVMFAVTELNRADIGDISTFNAKYVD